MNQKASREVPVHLCEYPEKPWSCIHVDYVGAWFGKYSSSPLLPFPFFAFPFSSSFLYFFSSFSLFLIPFSLSSFSISYSSFLSLFSPFIISLSSPFLFPPHFLLWKARGKYSMLVVLWQLSNAYGMCSSFVPCSVIGYCSRDPGMGSCREVC